MMRRTRITILAVLCLCLCGQWVRSYWWSDLVGWNTSPVAGGPASATTVFTTFTPTGTFLGLGTYRGSFYLVRLITANADNPRTGWSGARIESADDFMYSLADVHFAGFSVLWHGRDSNIAFVGVPLWLPLAIGAYVVIARRFRDR